MPSSFAPRRYTSQSCAPTSQSILLHRRVFTVH
ncbi:hypothetical protein FQN60_007628 [Etheostoma spectabile]|uniref:Uncharacterized protein n=1 Tax=Etheostoma spectabile TaxID=54343 RepID=A0A5J5CY30_9PERO|nr:hypothetical protein FQN60_007628 [Etheostoma spectabile]